jgi:hypothetical protein
MSLVSLLVLVIVAGLIWYLITLLPLPAPFKQVAMVIVILIAILVLVGYLPGGPRLIALT